MKTKLYHLFSLATDESLLSLWREKHPARYSEDEIGLNTWKEDVAAAFNIIDETNLKDILAGKNIDKLTDASQSDLTTLLPGGIEIAEQRRSKEKKHQKAVLPNGEKKNEMVVHNNVSGDDNFFQAVLVGLGVPTSENNMRYCYAWRQAEGGHAKFNPFNTTQKMDGATNYNSVGVKNYISEEQGIKATIKTLSNGRYADILAALRNDSPPIVTANALVASHWGTGELIKKVISGYDSGAEPKPPAIARIA